MNDESKAEKVRSLYTNPRVMVIALDAMLIMLGFGIVSPSMSFYLIALEGGLDQPPGPDYIVPAEVVAQFSLILGMMMAAFMATRTLLARYWGNASDVHGRKPIMMLGLGGYVLLLVLFGLAQDWIQMLLIRAFQGVVSAMVWPVAEASLMDIVGQDRRGEGLGLYMVVSNTGYIIGPGVGGFLYNFCRDFLMLPVPAVFRVPYFIGAVIALPAVIMTAVVLKETAPGKTTLSKEHERSVATETKGDNILDTELEQMNPKRRRMIHAIYVMALMNGFAMGLGQPIFQLFLMSKITSDIGLIGLIISGAGAVGILFSLPAGRYADSHGRKSIAVGGALASRGSFFVLPLTTTIPETSLVWIAQGASMSASQPALRALQADLVPWNLRGKLFGTIQAFFNAGATVGPLLGGTLYGVFSLMIFAIGPIIIEGLVIPFWLAGASGVLGAILLWRYVEETQPMKVVRVEDEREAVSDLT
jgi:MFS family permease